MDLRVGLIVLIVLAGSWACDARNFANSVLSVTSKESSVGKVDFCTMCEEYATVTIDYLSDNKTQAQFMGALHKACSRMPTLEDPCIKLVDSYAPLFFSSVSSIQPEELCDEVGLCSNARIQFLSRKQDKCELCHDAVDEVIVKFKDPDTKLGIIEVLLKACDTMEDYAKKCKSMVFQYGPLILTDAEKFMEEIDICTTVHACSKGKANTEEVSKVEDEWIEMVTST